MGNTNTAKGKNADTIEAFKKDLIEWLSGERDLADESETDDREEFMAHVTYLIGTAEEFTGYGIKGHKFYYDDDDETKQLANAINNLIILEAEELITKDEAIQRIWKAVEPIIEAGDEPAPTP